MNYLLLNRNFALKKTSRKLLRRLCVNAFITFERNYQTFNKIQAKRKFWPPCWRARVYKSYYFVEKSKYHKISPLHAFPLKFLVYDNFYALRQLLDSNSLFKGSIGHVTSWCKWYLLCHYDTNNSYFFCM